MVTSRLFETTTPRVSSTLECPILYVLLFIVSSYWNLRYSKFVTQYFHHNYYYCCYYYHCTMYKYCLRPCVVYVDGYDDMTDVCGACVFDKTSSRVVINRRPNEIGFVYIMYDVFSSVHCFTRRLSVNRHTLIII